MKLCELEKIPTPPTVAAKLLTLFGDENTSIDDIIKTISTDPALTARIINYCNSPVFGRQKGAQSLKQAVVLLGFRAVKLIALTFSLVQTRSPKKDSDFDFDEFWKNSLATAVTAQNLFALTRQPADQGFLMGLLLNVGAIAMHMSDAARYTELMEAHLNDPGVDLIELEKEYFGVSRFRLCGDLLEKWCFPAEMVDVVRALADCHESEEFSGAALNVKSIWLANRLSQLLFSETLHHEEIQNLIDQFSDFATIDRDQIEKFHQNACREWIELGGLLSYKCPNPKSLSDLENEARMRVMSITLNLDQAVNTVTKENEELKSFALIDSLTKIGNRHQYEQQAHGELARCVRTRRCFGLLVIDIDRFKSINDRLGHPGGDAVLVEVAARLAKNIRPYDSVYRIGGEEFVVILPECTEENCHVVAERLRRGIESALFAFEGDEFHVTISLGGAMFDGVTPQSLEDLYKIADEALYVAKNGGRNRFVFQPQTGAAAT